MTYFSNKSNPSKQAEPLFGSCVYFSLRATRWCPPGLTRPSLLLIFITEFVVLFNSILLLTSCSSDFNDYLSIIVPFCHVSNLYPYLLFFLILHFSCRERNSQTYGKRLRISHFWGARAGTTSHDSPFPSAAQDSPCNHLSFATIFAPAFLRNQEHNREVRAPGR